MLTQTPLKVNVGQLPFICSDSLSTQLCAWESDLLQSILTGSLAVCFPIGFGQWNLLSRAGERRQSEDVYLTHFTPSMRDYHSVSLITRKATHSPQTFQSLAFS